MNDSEAALREARAELAAWPARLEQAVAERTTELAASTRQMEAFVFTVAHDLRAPLRSMQNFSSLLLERAGPGLSEACRDFAVRINRSALFMDTLLVDLLSFSRVSQQPMDLEPVELEGVVRSVLVRLEKEIEEKKAAIEVAGTWPSVRAYQPVLAQVLLNLIGNSLKFSAPEVPPRIRLRAETLGGVVRTWVEDNGIGIEPTHHEQIFRPFTRLHGETYGGTGIGLAIVQKGIERMGGKVGVQADHFQGSRFWFDLPRAEVP
ncbi:MAG TPA: ATP-binding protein [Verrucomicrobiae bacterium]